MFSLNRKERNELQKEIDKHNKLVKKYKADNSNKIDYVDYMMKLKSKEQFKDRLKALKQESKLLSKVEKYNNKIKKEIAKGININILPKQISKKEIIENSDTVRNVKALENMFKAVNKKDAFKLITNINNVHSTNAQQEILKIKVEEQNYNIREKQKEYEDATIMGRKMTEEEKLFFKSDLNVNKIREKTYDFDKFRTAKEIQYFEEGVKHYSRNHHWRDEEYKQNYIKSLEDTLPPYLRERFTEYMKTVPAEEIARAYYVDRTLNIQLNYEQMGGSGTELKEFVKRTIHDWNKVQGKKDSQKLFDKIDKWKYTDEEVEDFYKVTFERQKLKGEIKKRRK